MITYAGIPLTPPHDAQLLVERWWHGHRIQEFEYPAYNAAKIDRLPIPYPPEQEPPRIGALRWPTGASRWATCHLAVPGVQVELIRAAVGSTPRAVPLIFADGGTGIAAANMWLLPPRPISQRGDGAEHYLLTLVDERYWWWQRGDRPVPQFGSGGIATWDTFLALLFASLGVSASIAAVPAAYGTPDSRRWLLGSVPLPLVIDAACRTVGLRVVRSLEGVVRVVNYQTASIEDGLRWSSIRYGVLTGGQITTNDIGRALPASVAVVFPPGDTSSDSDVWPFTSLSLATEYGVPLPVMVPGWVGRVAADRTLSGGPRLAYSAQAAADFYRWSLSRTDCTVRGFLTTSPIALDYAQEWIHTPDWMVTRIIRPPWGDHGGWGEAGSGDDECWGDLVYKDECTDGFLVRYRATGCSGSSPDWQWDADLGVPCDGSGSGSGSGSGPDYPTTIVYVSDVCRHCTEPPGVLLWSNVVLGPPCFQAASGIEAHGAYLPYVRLLSDTTIIEKRRVIVRAFSETADPECDEAGSDCCSGSDDGSGASGGSGFGECCPCEDPVSVPYVASGPFGPGCEECVITGTLVPLPGGLLTWVPAGNAGCPFNYTFDFSVFCIDGQWRIAGVIQADGGPRGHFDVVLLDDGNFLVGEVTVPGCVEPVTFVAERPCSGLPCPGSGSAPGSGGIAACCPNPLNPTLYLKFLTGASGTIPLVWNGSTYWLSGAVTVSCGATMYFRYSLGCVLEFSCNGSSWTACTCATNESGFCGECGPPYLSGIWTIFGSCPPCGTLTASVGETA